MKAHKKNPTLIRVTFDGETIAHITCEEFRNSYGHKNDFVGALVERFNAEKEARGDPERVRQVIQLTNGKTV